MKKIGLDLTKTACFLGEGAVKAFEPKVKEAQLSMEDGTCPGNDYLGWLHLPTSISEAFLDEIQAVADSLREKCEVVVVAGIGGSYLGARAVIRLRGFNTQHPTPNTQHPSFFSLATTSARTTCLNSRNT